MPKRRCSTSVRSSRTPSGKNRFPPPTIRGQTIIWNSSTSPDLIACAYTNVIGLEKRGDYPTPVGPRFLTVGVKGQDFELVLWPGTPGKAKAGSAVYTIEVENCRMAFETLKSRGVKFEAPEILEFPWGYAARFQDPDGNLLQVREGRGAFRR